jgi:hypothetical protein
MGTGDRMTAIVDAVADALDLPPNQRAELEQELADDPEAFGEKYLSFLEPEHRRLLGVEPHTPS